MVAPFLVSEAALTETTISEGDNQGLPNVRPPRIPWYTLMGGEWQAKLAQHIGTTPYLHIGVRNPDTDFWIYFDSYIAEGGGGSFMFQAPWDTMGSQYQVTDWTIKIRKGYANAVEDVLSANLETWKQREVWTWLAFMGIQEKLPLYKWQVMDIEKGRQPQLVLTDQRYKLLKKQMHADGIWIPTRSGVDLWAKTTEITSAAGTFDDDDPQDGGGLRIWSSRCEIGDWEIEFTSSSLFNVHGPGIDIEGNDIANDFHAVMDLTPAAGNAQLTIYSSAWGGTWADGDTITFQTTYSFKPYLGADEYIRVPEAMYHLCRYGGYAKSDFDASPSFPTPVVNPPGAWLFAGYPYIDTGNWVDLHGWGQDVSGSWDWAEWVALHNAKIRIAFTHSCTVLSAIGEVGTHGPAYIVPGHDGKIRCVSVGAPTTTTDYHIKTETGVCSAVSKTRTPVTTVRGQYAYDYVDSEQFKLIYFAPENRSDPNIGQALPENEQEMKFLGYQSANRSQVDRVLEIWYRMHGGGFPWITANMGLHQWCIQIGDVFKMTSTDADVSDTMVTPYSLRYDLGNWRVVGKFLDWGRIEHPFMVWQPEEVTVDMPGGENRWAPCDVVERYWG